MVKKLPKVDEGMLFWHEVHERRFTLYERTPKIWNTQTVLPIKGALSPIVQVPYKGNLENALKESLSLLDGYEEGNHRFLSFDLGSQTMVYGTYNHERKAYVGKVTIDDGYTIKSHPNSKK